MVGCLETEKLVCIRASVYCGEVRADDERDRVQEATELGGALRGGIVDVVGPRFVSRMRVSGPGLGP